MKQKKALKILSALAQDTRINIYRLLIKEGKEGLSAGIIADILQVPAATLSFHLSQMTNAGLLKSRKAGRVVIYSARPKAIKKLAEFMTEGSWKKSKDGSSDVVEDMLLEDEDIENDGD